MRFVRSRSRACAIGLATLGAVSVASATAAQERRVGLAGMEASVSAPLALALEPWGVVVVSLADAPGASMPGSAAESRELARSIDAVAVVWLSGTDDGWTVWVYDVADDRVLARQLTTGPPFDEPTASALALTIVSLLRHGAAAPETERVRAPAALSTEPGENETGGDATRIEIGAGITAFATSPLEIEPRLSVAAAYAPAATGGALGVGLVVRAGTGVGVANDRLSARLHDVHLLGRVSGVFQLAGPLTLGLGADVGARVTILDASPAVGPALEVVRAVGLGSAWLALGLDLGTVALWLRAGGLATPWPQEYLVRGQPELATEPVWGFAELALELGL